MNNNYNLVFGIPWSSCLHDPTGPGSPGRNPVSVVNSLIYEVMEAFTTALMTTSNVAYSSQLGSSTTIATIQGLIGATYHGMGRGGGSFMGGFLMKRFEVDQDKTAGTRVTF